MRMKIMRQARVRNEAKNRNAPTPTRGRFVSCCRMKTTEYAASPTNAAMAIPRVVFLPLLAR